jgi:hypothetical protein
MGRECLTPFTLVSPNVYAPYGGIDSTLVSVLVVDRGYAPGSPRSITWHSVDTLAEPKKV